MGAAETGDHELGRDDIAGRLDQGDARFDSIDKTLKTILQRTEDLPAMRRDLKKTRELVEAWATVKNVGKFVRWFAPVMAGIVAIVVAVKTGIAHLR